MNHHPRDPKVDDFLSKSSQWRDEYIRLRTIVLDCGLMEEWKWMHPCYTIEHKNIVLIHGFKEYCALLFFKGALLRDLQGVLVQQTQNVQSGRQIRFTNIQEINNMETLLKSYIAEAIEVEQAGLEVNFKSTTQFSVPEEFQRRLDELPSLKTAFESLTPGRQRGYLLYFSKPKQSKTRQSRVDKYIPQILLGKGLQDSDAP